MAIDEPLDLPVLDFSKFTKGSPEDRQRLAESLVQSFRDHGFVRLVHHGVPEKTVRNYMQGATSFFKLPVDTKMRIANVKGPKPQRGFSWAGAEQTSKLRPENMIGHDSWKDLNDHREHFDAGPPSDNEFPNQWPTDEELPGFQALMEECYLIFQEICLRIMSALEVGLRLPTDTLVARCRPASSELRLNHYPPISLEELALGRTKRTWPHTDFGIITLLFQDRVGGLELEDRRRPGTFAGVPVAAADDEAQPAEMVVNISDTFQRWTNDFIRAGVHQVNVPPHLKEAKTGFCPERHSGIFFFKAHRDTSVGPLKEFVDEAHPAKYDEVTALEYQRRMTKVLY